MRRLRRRPRWPATATPQLAIVVSFLASILVPAAGASARAAPGDPAPVSEPAPAVAAPVAAAPAAAPPTATPDAAEAAAALRATQELESRLIQMSAELGGLEKERASWEDIRRRLDELSARVDRLAEDLRTAQDRAAAPPALSPSARPGEPMDGQRAGVVVRSRDGAFLLRARVFLQIRYEGALVDPGPGEAAAPDRSSFLIRRAEVLAEGHAWSPQFEYRLQLDFADPALVKDAFVQWRSGRAVAVRAGQFKVPFGFQRQLLSAYYELTDLSEAMAAFSLERDVGVMILGRPFGERLSYQLSVTNGAGQGKVNDNLDLAYGLRVVASPFGPLPEQEGDLLGQPRPLLAIGGSAYYSLVPTDIRARTGNANAPVDVDHDGRVDNVAVWQGAVELRALWRGAALQAELFQRREHPGAAAPDRDSWGCYAQASYFVIPHFLQVAARIGRTDLPLYGASLADRQLRGDRVDEQTGAVSAYLRGHDIKLQVDYSHLGTRDVVVPGVVPGATYAPDAHRVRVQAQLMF